VHKQILLLPGDGIGPEVVAEAAKVLAAAAATCKVAITTQTELIGGAAIDATGTPLPEATLAACQKADAILLGAVGGPKWDSLPNGQRPENGLLGLRKALGLYANLRPATVYPELAELSCLRESVAVKGFDLLVVRELTGDVYFGQPAARELRNNKRCAYNTMIYDEDEIRRIARVAFVAARSRRNKVCSVDKANVLHTSRLWREVVEEEQKHYPDVELSHMYVDNCAMQLIANPAQFDVILTGNLFGDILSDEAAAAVGSLGMLPSASVSGTAEEGGIGLYEPVHGSAPDIAGQNRANPMAAILSAALMLRMSLDLPAAATAVEKAVRRVLKEGWRTADIAPAAGKGTPLGCREAGDMVARYVGEPV